MEDWCGRVGNERPSVYEIQDSTGFEWGKSHMTLKECGGRYPPVGGYGSTVGALPCS